MKHMKQCIAVMTALVLLLGLFAGCQGQQDASAAKTPITLEAASAVTVYVNSNQVVSDSDAALNGGKLDKAVSTIIGNWIQAGELNTDANTVLITVGDASLQQTVLNYATEAFAAKEFAGAAICQSAEDTVKGKVQLIQKLVAANATYIVAELEGLSINQLALLCQSYQAQLQGISLAGTASQELYIGADTAQEIALLGEDTTADAVEELIVILDYNAGVMFYDVTFKLDGTAYEAYIEADSGKLLYGGIVGGERTDDDVAPEFTEEDAIAAACASIDADATAITNVTCTFNDTSAQYFFEVKFTYQNTPYTILISSATGLPLEGDVAPDVTDPDGVVPDITMPNEEDVITTIPDSQPVDPNVEETFGDDMGDYTDDDIDDNTGIDTEADLID